MHRSAMAAVCAGCASAVAGQADLPGPVRGMVQVDFRKLIARGDLEFRTQAAHANLGLPVGNGRTAALVSTLPDRLRFTVNRFDVVSGNSADHGDYKQYANACSQVAVVLGDGAFPSNRVIQHLSVYDGRLEVQGAGVRAAVFAWPRGDVLAVEVMDERETPAPLRLELTPALTGGRNQQGAGLWRCTAVSTQVQDRAVNTLSFETVCDTGLKTNDHYCQAAVVAEVVGRPARITRAGAKMTVEVSAGRGSCTVLIGSAATMDRARAPLKDALAAVTVARERGTEGLVADTEAAWHDFWSRSFVWIPSTGNKPSYAENHVQHWITVFYNMACSMRGAYPAKFNGMYVNGDGRRDWGFRYWWFNQGRMGHYAADKANHPELNESLFNWFDSALPKMRAAARQQWGSQGLFFPEVMGWDGPEILPDPVAAELRDYLLNQKITPSLVAFKRSRNLWESRWSWEQDGWKAGHHTHLLYNGADMANLYWARYQYTCDEAWLRDRAYPVIRDVAEFYRNFPGLRKADDGKYHIRMTGWAETYMGMNDCFQDMAFMRGVFPVAIRASERLGVDADLRPRWAEILENLGPYPTQLAGIKNGYGVGNNPRVTGNGGGSCWDERLGNLLDFDVLNLESRDRKGEEWTCTEKTLEGLEAYHRIMKGESPGNDGDQPWSRFLSNAARMGRADVTRKALDAYLLFWRKSADARWPNHLDQRNGSANMGLTCDAPLVEGLQDALLDSLAPEPGGKCVIHVFPAWPLEIEAAFKLAAKGGFVVTSSVKGGKVGFVEIESQVGQPCRVANPWKGGKVDLYRSGRKTGVLDGGTLSFDTVRGERMVLLPAGVAPEACRLQIP